MAGFTRSTPLISKYIFFNPGLLGAPGIMSTKITLPLTRPVRLVTTSLEEDMPSTDS